MSRSKKNKLTGPEALEAAYTAVDHQPLLDALGVDIPDEYLRLALTHRSFANENDNLTNNERLEFLGDAVLSLSVAGQLYEQYPSRTESELTKMRASMVSRYGLADVARGLGVGDHVLLGKGELTTGGRDKESVLEDTTEALFGAIYRAHGFAAARGVILRIFKDKIDHASAKSINSDWKTTLQERIAELKAPMPAYDTTSVGPDHDQTFTAHAMVGELRLGTGEGPNKKTAEQQAAHRAYLKLLDDQSLVAQVAKINRA